MTIRNDLKRFKNRIGKTLKMAVTPSQLSPVAKEAIRLIVTRTRLGDGVSRNGKRQKLRSQHKHSKVYQKFRKRYAAELDATTTPASQNLTFTGQLLRSIDIIKHKSGSILIGPKGNRSTRGKKKPLTNYKLAQYLVEMGYSWMDLTTTEERQLVRFYRRRFGDLVKKRLT